MHEFFDECNNLLYTPHPGPKLNNQWWLDLFKTLPQTKANKLLVKGIEEGVRLGIKKKHGPLLQIPKNMVNNVKECEELLKKLIKDLGKRNKQPVLYTPTYIASIFMKDEVTKYRLISDASRKFRGFGSLNENIKDEFKPVYLWNLKELCKWLYLHGNKRGLYITTFDLEDYFHHFLLHPDDVKYVGYQVFGKKLVALYSPYGVSSVPRIACTHSELTTVPFHRLLPRWCQNILRWYVDDSTLIHWDYWTCHTSSLLILKLIIQAGLKENVKKRSWVKQESKIYGWIFYTESTPIRISLPYKKRIKIALLLEIFLKVEYCTIAFLFKLTGTLMHYAQVNKVIKVICIKFIRIIYDIIDKNISIKKQVNKLVYIPAWFKSHFKIWKDYTTKHIEFPIDTVLKTYKQELVIATDATLISYGIYCNGYYISELLPIELIGQPIHICEAWAVLQAVNIFSKWCKSKNVVIYCDNEPACDVFTNYWCKNMAWEPYLYQRARYMMEYDCIIDVVHVSGECNKLADTLSRGRMQDFHAICSRFNRKTIKRLHPKPFKFFK